jgi:hypothetical protein
VFGREPEDLKIGVLRLECLSITLSNGDEETPQSFAGPGEIHFDEDGQLEVILYDQEHQADPRALFSTGPVGSWVPQSELFDLKAADLSGNVWTACNLRPDIKAHVARPGAVVRARIQSLSSTSSPERAGQDWLWLYFAERIDTPANVSTVTTIQDSADDRPRTGFVSNVWAITCGGLNIRLRRGEAGFEINVLGEAGSIRPGLDTRLEEALWFSLAQPLTADVIQYRRGEQQGIVLRSRARREKVRTAVSPYSVHHVDAATVLGEILCRYLAYVAQDDAPRFHPLSVLIRKVLRAGDGTIEEFALALCVSIEGIVHLAFSDLGQAEAEVLSAVSELEELLKGHLESSLIKERVRGFFAAVKGPSSRTAIRSLVKRGVITHEQFEAWEGLRHVAAHGKEYDLPFRELYELSWQLRVLMAKLVFELVGYTGPYTDYGTLGWPTQRVNEVNPEAAAS